MPTNINTYDGNLVAVVSDNNLNTTSSTLEFPGIGYRPFGSAVLNDIVWTMTNFAGNIQPILPLRGQTWYDTGNSQIKIHDPVAFSNNWQTLAPIGSSTSINDPINPSILKNTAIEAIQITDTFGVPHPSLRYTINGNVTAVLSGSDVFSTNISAISTTVPGFNKIYPGLNISSSITNAGVSTNRVILDGSLSPNSTNGAIEFDGTNFYFSFPNTAGLVSRNIPVFSNQLLTTNRVYVSLNGSDTNPDGSINYGFSDTQPVRSIRAALANPSVLAGGYTIIVESGSYIENNPMYVPAKTSIVGDDLRRVIIIPLYPKRDIFHVDSGTYFYGLTFKNHQRPAFALAYPTSLANATITSGNLSLTYQWSYSNYQSPPNVFVEPNLTNTSNAVVSANLVNGAITDIMVTYPGSGYTSPPAVTITGTSGSAVAVSRINNSGQVIAVEIIDPGTGYSTTPWPTVSIASPASGTTATAIVPQPPYTLNGKIYASNVTTWVNGLSSTALMATSSGLNNGVIRSFNISNAGGHYTHIPVISIDSPLKSNLIITSSPYIQNSSSISGPYDLNGVQIPFPNQPVTNYVPNTGYGLGPSLPFSLNAVPGFSNVDITGAGAGIRVDGQVLSNNTVIRSFVADAFTQVNQGGEGHLVLNQAYAQFVSCFTTFSSVGYWARSGGFANISNSVIDFGNIGLKADGYYPVSYVTGTVSTGVSSTVGAVKVVNGGNGYVSNFTVNFINAVNTIPAYGTAIVQSGSVISVTITSPGKGYQTIPTVDFSPGGIFGANEAQGLAFLSPNNPYVTVTGLATQPQFNSIMKFLTAPGIYTVSNVSGSGSTWQVTTNPSVYNVTVGDTASFYASSNLSTGALAMEYVGSGTTYNALPVYNGIPNAANQIQDGITLNDPTNAGRVYYVTIDNTGNFKIGSYFSVNFSTGAITLSPGSTLNISGLTSIGPFFRNGLPTGTFANAISDDITLGNSTPAYQHNTLPTQFAVNAFVVNNFFTNIAAMPTNILPFISNTYNFGGPLQKWSNAWINTTHSNIMLIGVEQPTVFIGIPWTNGAYASNLTVVYNSNFDRQASFFATPVIEPFNDTYNYSGLFIYQNNTATNAAAVTTYLVNGGNGFYVGQNYAYSSGSLQYNKNDAFIELDDNANIWISTNSTPRLIVSNTGNIGFGITNPSSALHIVTNSNGSTGINVVNQNSGGAAQSSITLNANSSSNAGWTLGQQSSGAGFLTTSQASNFSLTSNGGNQLIVNTNGNIGMGVSSPNAQLHILSKTSGEMILLQSAGASPPNITFQYASGSIAAPNAILDGTQLWTIGSNPYIGGSSYANMLTSYILASAHGVIGPTNYGSNFQINITPQGTTTAQQTLTLTSGTAGVGYCNMGLGNGSQPYKTQLILSNSSAGVAIALPAQGDINSGSIEFFTNFGTNLVMHLDINGNLISDASGGTLGVLGKPWADLFSTTINNSGTIYTGTVASGSVFFNDGTFQSSAGYAAFAATGFTAWPNGSIMQWGNSNTDGTGTQTTTFYETFPTNCWSVMITPTPNNGITFAVLNITTSGFSVKASSSTNFYYMAIGN